MAKKMNPIRKFLSNGAGKSIPWFVILLLCFTMTAGFYFQKTKDDIAKFKNSDFSNEPWFLFQQARADEVSTGATVANDIPTVSAVSLNDGTAITVASNNTQIVNVTGKIDDNNGCGDISAVAARIYFGAAGDQCAANDNTCYVITGADCSSTCQGTTEAHVTCPAGLWYHVEPTDDSGAQEWLGTIFATDSVSATHKASNPSTVEVNGAFAMTVINASLAYGSLAVGNNTGTNTQPALVMNIANTAIDANVSGTAMTSATAGATGTIAVGKQKWHVGGFNYATGGTVLTASNTLAELSCPKPTSNTPSNSSDTIGWGLGIDLGTGAGTDYSGKNTFSVTND